MPDVLLKGVSQTNFIVKNESQRCVIKAAIIGVRSVGLRRGDAGAWNDRARSDSRNYFFLKMNFTDHNFSTRFHHGTKS